MNMKEYFESTEGTGVLATSDAGGKVDAAIYARPRVLDDHTIAFIMGDRLSHKNLHSNPHAAYLFMEKNGHFSGKRLYITKLREDDDRATIEEEMRKRDPHSVERYGNVKKFLVYFKVDSCLPLVGSAGEDECFL